MARMPGAEWLGEHAPQPRRFMERYDVVCVHTIVGFAPAHAAHFSVKADGTILQSRDTAFRSAANLDGNHRVIAIENEDHGPAFMRLARRMAARRKNPGRIAQRLLAGVPPLTPAQVRANGRILAWSHLMHRIPLQLCPDARPGSRGLAYHRQGIDGNFDTFAFPGRVPGGEHWSSSFGKICPGDARIAQRPNILERALELIQGKDEDEMTPEHMEALAELIVRKLERREGKLAALSRAVRRIGNGLGIATDDKEAGT